MHVVARALAGALVALAPLVALPASAAGPDGTPPRVTWQPAVVVLNPESGLARVGQRFPAVDDAGIASHDFRRRSGSPGAPLSGWVRPETWQGIAEDGVGTATVAGRRTCLSSRATDVTGTVGPWVDAPCTPTPYDDTLLAAYGAARAGSSSTAYAGTTRTLYRSAALKTATLRGDRLWVRVVVGPRQGTLRAEYAGRWLATRTLRADVRRWAWLPLPVRSGSATLVLRHVPGTGPTVVDAVGVRSPGDAAFR